MSTLIALLTVALMLISSFFTDGSARYFDLNTKKGMAPLAVTFSTQTLKDAKLAEKFIWNFGDGQTLTTTSTNAVHTFTQAGIFTAKLQYLTKSTDAVTKAKDGGSVKVVVTARPNILPVAKLDCISNEFNKVECEPVGSVDSDGLIVSYKYEWGDSTNTVATNLNKVTHSYSTSGDKVIRLTVTDNLGATAFVEKTQTIRSNTAPVANFSCTKTGTLKIHCSNASTDADETLTDFKWTLDDGTIYTTKDFDHTFNKRPQDVAVTNHSINLLATDAQGLTSTSTKSVDVDLEALTTLPRGYFKVFMEGTNVNLHTFITKTQFSIKRAYYTVYGASSTPLQTIELTEFYANTVNKVNLAAYGNYKIVLTAIDMRDQVFQTSRSFTLTADTSALAPYVDYRSSQTAPRTLYLNLNPSFDYDEFFYISEFTIDMGDGVQKKIVDDTFLTYTYAAAGTYTVKVTAKTVHGTQTVVTRSLTVTNDEVAISRPDPTFNYEIYTYAQNVSFYDEKSGTPNGQIISYVWDFGDGSSATGETQAHFYSPGSYLVTLTVTDTAGMTASQLQRVNILAEGSDLIAHLNCGYAAPFVDIIQKCEVVALDKLNDISSIRVFWGNNTASLLTTPTDATQGIYNIAKKYDAPGAYAVKLVVTTNRGIVTATTKNIVLTSRPPIAGLQCSANGQWANCSALGSFDPKGGSLTYTFNYQDGFIETNSSGLSSHSFQVSGLYDVTVTVVDSAGVSSIAIAPVQIIIPKPVASLQCLANGFLVNCNAMGSFDPKGGPLIFIFNYQDGFIESNTTGFSSHAYQIAGLYNVSVTVLDNIGISSIAMAPIQIIAPKPIANLQCTINNLMAFCNGLGSYDPLMKGLTYEFDYGDGFKEANANGISSHAYTSAGLYSVIVKVVDYIGSNTVASFQVQAILPQNKLPQPQLYCYSNAPNILRCNANASNDEDGSIVAFKYEWDDGVSETHALGEEIFHFFTSGGPHQVTLTVTDNDGGVKSITASFIAQSNNPPIAALNCYNIGPQKIHCNSNSFDSDPNDMITEYKWDIGDGNSSFTTLVPSIEYLYSQVGTYTITLQVKDLMGLTASNSQSIKVVENQAPVVKPNCFINTGLTYQCNANAYDSDGQIVESVWTIEGHTFSGLSVLYNFTNGGDKNIQFMAKDDLGKVTTSIISVHVDKPIADFSCLTPVPFHVSCKYVKPAEEQKKIVAVRYFVDERDVYEGDSFEHDFLVPGEHKVVLKIYADDGAESSIEKSIQINDVYLSPKASFASFADIGYKVKMNASESFIQGRKVVSFKWNFGDGNIETTTESISNHSYQNAGSYNVILIVRDDLGNTNSLTKSLYVYNSEVADPGDVNSETLEGIDLDNDGIRDDVQRWISFEAKDKVDVKLLLKKLAQNYQLQIINNSDPVMVNDSEVKKNKITTCLLGKVNDDNVVRYYQKIFQYLYTSTETRSKAWSLVKSNLSGVTQENSPSDQASRLVFCEGI